MPNGETGLTLVGIIQRTRCALLWRAAGCETVSISPRQATAQTAESREGFYTVVLKTTEQLLHVINFTPFE